MSIRNTNLQNLFWYVSVLVASAGVISLGAGWRVQGTVLLTVGAGLLGTLALRATWSIRRDGMGTIVGGLFGFATGIVAVVAGIGLGLGLAPATMAGPLRIAVLATAGQIFLAVLAVRPAHATRTTRWVVPVTGHTAVAFGTALVLELVPYAARTVMLAYVVGFFALLLHAFWMRLRADERVVPARPDTPGRRWSAVLTIAITVGVLAAVVAEFAAASDGFGFVVRSDALIAGGTAARAGATVAGLAAVVGVATVAAPPHPPKALDVFTGPVSTVVQHAVTLILLVNALLVAILVAAPVGYELVLGLFLTYLVVSVMVEYLSVVQGRRLRKRFGQGDRSPPPREADESVTVVVSAFNDAEVLRESLDHNLEVWDDVPFIVVPAVRSTDETVEVAREFQSEYPDQVRVVEGTGGSKAADLNLVWDAIDTDYVLLLDSDETADAGFVSRGLETLRHRPEVGVVQGRKVSENPGRNALSRFTSVERQQSTWLEHPYMDEQFGAGHFGGSVALLRREVPPSVDGWKADALTEDIDFTVRLQLETDWKVAYDAEMVARESTPQTFRGLIRQRQRWTRGWAAVAESYLGRILSSPGTLGARRTTGFAWLLFTSISAPLATIFPAILFGWLLGGFTGLPLLVALPLAVFLFPARMVSFGYAAFRDPVLPLPVRLHHVGRVLTYGYLWLLFGWIVQTHSLYLELAGAPNVWQVTPKRARGVAPRQRVRTPDSKAVFEVYRDRADEWRWRLRHNNGNIISDSGEGYKRRDGCLNGIESVKRTIADATVMNLETDGGSGTASVASDGATVELYRDRADEWRWRLVHNNGNIIADSSEGYERIAGARDGLSSVSANAPTAPVVDLQ